MGLEGRGLGESGGGCGQVWKVVGGRWQQERTEAGAHSSVVRARVRLGCRGLSSGGQGKWERRGCM